MRPGPRREPAPAHPELPAKTAVGPGQRTGVAVMAVMAAAQPMAPVPLSSPLAVFAAVALPGRADVDLAASGASAPRLPYPRR